MPATLAQALVNDRIGFDDLHRRYSPVLGLVKVLIGVVPNCDPYLEIWRPGFRTYNLMVPAFLNLPLSLLNRGAPKDVVGLGMYVSSRAASCAYCSAHTCSFALRRGASAGAVTGASRTPAQASAVALVEALSTMPHHYTTAHRADLERHYGAVDAEWIAMGAAMMGFLNKFMDAIGVELEPEAVNDVAELIEPTGWAVGQHGWASSSSGAGALHTNGDARGGLPPTDSMLTLLKVMRRGPGAVRLDREWTRDVPADAAQARRFVTDRFGWDEPLLEVMGHARPRRALAAMLRHNLDPDQSEVGIGIKMVAGLVFAAHAGNVHLSTRCRALAVAAGVGPAVIEAAATRDSHMADDMVGDAKLRAVIALARAVAPSPAAVDATTIATAESALRSAEIVELTVWVSVCQLIHRLTLYHGSAGTGLVDALEPAG